MNTRRFATCVALSITIAFALTAGTAMSISNEPYFDKDGHLKVHQVIDNGTSRTVRERDSSYFSADPEERTHVDAATLEAKGKVLDVGDGDAVIYVGMGPVVFPGSTMAIPEIIGTTRLADKHGNRVVGSAVVALRNGKNVFRGYAYYWEGTNNRLVIAAPQSLDQMLRSNNDLDRPLDSKALLRSSPDGKLEYVMEHPGDYVAIPDPSTTPLGVGSELRFDPENWVDLLGVKYRKGGFTVAPDNLQFTEGTEKLESGAVLTWKNGQWAPPVTSAPSSVQHPAKPGKGAKGNKHRKPH
jgi:hypothetical protein